MNISIRIDDKDMSNSRRELIFDKLIKLIKKDFDNKDGENSNGIESNETGSRIVGIYEITQRKED